MTNEFWKSKTGRPAVIAITYAAFFTVYLLVLFAGFKADTQTVVPVLMIGAMILGWPFAVGKLIAKKVTA